MTNTNKKSKNTRKLLGAVGMLSVSAAMLVSSTFAWFTMNKEVKATTMQVKAHAEEGLLINEVAAFDDTNWDEQAQAKATGETYALRPASTADLSTWWHANSRKSADEAGVDALTDTVDVDTNGNKYTNISSSGGVVSDNVVVDAVGGSGSAKATGGSQAETHIYYKDASYGQNTNAYDDGEGYYVNYKYYIKSSKSESALTVTKDNLLVGVTATKLDEGTSDTLDKALRVGVKIENEFKIYTPLAGDTSYKVTGDAKGTVASQVSVTALGTGKLPFNTTAALDIPSVKTNGKLVDVYIWFEGEDQNCMSDNITAALAAYKIDITFTDNDL